MRYAFLVAWREYVESARAKGFWIGIFLMPAILFLAIQMPIWLEQRATPIRYFLIVDQSGNLAAPIESRLESTYQKRVLEALNEYGKKYSLPNSDTNPLPTSVDSFITGGGQEAYLKKLQSRLRPGAPPFETPRRLLRSVKPPPGMELDTDVASASAALKPYVRGAKKIEVDGQQVDLSAAILIPQDIETRIVRPNRSSADHRASALAPVSIQYWSINTSDTRLREQVEQAVNSEIRRREYLARGLDAAAVHQVEQTYVPFISLNPKKEKGKETVSTVDTIKQWAPSGFVYLLWLSIFMIVQMLLNNTIEEKSNRIIEVLLSSVTPGELMMGKLFGIAAVGLTMVAAWIAALFAILSWKAGGSSEIAGHLLAVLRGSNFIFLFAFYFVLGYLMYAGFILSIGSVCNTLKEAQSYMGVLTIVMMVPIFTMTFIPKDPNGPLARILSWIPIYTPFTMMNRAAADPPLIDLIGTFILLVVSTVGAMWMAGKIFRIGILRTGQPPKMIEMLRWALSKQK